MNKILFTAGWITLLTLFIGLGQASAQNLVPNGDFEMKARDNWELTGQNTGALCAMYDCSGQGRTSWCWRRTPGTTNGNGGLMQDVCLFGGVTYNFSAYVVYTETG